jgi:hypothetical protein
MKNFITIALSFIAATVMLYILSFMILMFGIATGNIDPNSQDNLSNHFRTVLSKLN